MLKLTPCAASGITHPQIDSLIANGLCYHVESNVPFGDAKSSWFTQHVTIRSLLRLI
jgi:hypothetical protein